mgnify:CR=1 FL=1
MTISTEKLIELISEKSELNNDQARSWLDDLIQNINRELDRKGEYAIERFGIFKMQDGELVFEPSETLAAEINYKYSGMKPIEIMEAEQKSALRKTMASSEEEPFEAMQTVNAESAPENEEDDSLGLQQTDDSASGKQEAGEPEETAAPASYASREKEHEARTEKDPAESPAASAKGGADTGKKVETSTGKSKKGEQETGRPIKQVGTTKGSKVERPSVQEKSRNDSVMDLVRTAGAIVLIALTVYFVYLLMGNIKPGGEDSDASGPEQAEVTSPMGTDNGKMDESGNTGDGTASEEKASDKDKKAKASQNKKQSGAVDRANREIESSELDSDFEYSEISTSTYGLRGQPSDLGMKGYTIVIYSFSDRANAKEIQKTLLSKGYRVILNPASVDDKEVWRVGIGQFPTISRAEDAAKKLPEPYNTKHFLKRINR